MDRSAEANRVVRRCAAAGRTRVRRKRLAAVTARIVRNRHAAETRKSSAKRLDHLHELVVRSSWFESECFRTTNANTASDTTAHNASFSSQSKRRRSRSSRPAAHRARQGAPEHSAARAEGTRARARPDSAKASLDWPQLSVFQDKKVAAPGHGVSRVAGDPDEQGGNIAQR